MKRIRILHLIDPAGPLVGPGAVAMLADLAASSAARRVDLLALILGGSGAENLARDLGVNSHDRAPAYGGRPWLGVSAVRRYLAAIGPVDLLHCWSPATLALATLVAPATPRLLTLAANPIATSQGQWLRLLAAQSQAPLAMLPASNCIKRAWAEAGVDPAIMHVLRPGLDLTRLQTDQRASLRREWGVRSNDTTVVAIMTQHGPCVDATRAAHVLANATLSGLDVVLVAPAEAARRAAARTIACGSQAPDRLVFESRLARPWEVLPGCDVALVLGDDTRSGEAEAPSGRAATQPLARAAAALGALLGRPRQPRPGQVHGVLPMLWAAAAGKIIIAEAGYAVAEIVENGKTALVVKPGDNGAIVQRLREVIADPHRAWSLRDTARSEAYSFFSCSRFAEGAVAVYEQILAGGEIAVPELPLTGGLAFAGRT